MITPKDERFASAVADTQKRVPMQYAITLFWNGTRVMEGKATAVVAHDITRAHVEGQFVGAVEKGSYEDSTGRADFTIERIEA